MRVVQKAILIFIFLFFYFFGTINNLLFNSTFKFEKSWNLTTNCDVFNPFKILPKNDNVILLKKIFF